MDRRISEFKMIHFGRKNEERCPYVVQLEGGCGRRCLLKGHIQVLIEGIV